MGDMSGGSFLMNNHTLSQQYCGSNHGDVSIGCGFFNRHALYQCEDSSTFNEIDDDVENCDVDVSSGYDF